VLSHAERRQFDDLSRVLRADPYLAAVIRAADRRARRRRIVRWLAPRLVAWSEARRGRRLLTRGR
jgi:hypothetical protein